jgi:Ca2+:H+ antiporter
MRPPRSTGSHRCVVVLALVGTAADLFAAVVFARQDNMDIVHGMCIGSAIQIALVVAPGARAGLVDHRPSDEPRLRSPLDLFAIAGAAFIVRSVAADGETTWFEGLLLVGVYLLFALSLLFREPGLSLCGELACPYIADEYGNIN